MSQEVVFLNGKPVENAHENHEHVSPVSTYVAVFSALLVLTGLTYAVSYADLGPASLTVAMIVASIKAALVIGYFMHLKYEDRVYAFMFGMCIMFVGIFFFGVLTDMSASGDLNDETHIRFKRSVEDSAERIDNLNAMQ